MNHTWKEIGRTWDWDPVGVWQCQHCGAHEDSYERPDPEKVVVQHMLYETVEPFRPWSPSMREFTSKHPAGATCTQVFLWRYQTLSKNWIALADCEHRSLYRTHARNIRVGVFNGQDKSFVGLRTKFDSTFIDREFHWDTGEPFGTAKPFVQLEDQIPDGLVLEDKSKELFAWLEEMTKKHK